MTIRLCILQAGERSPEMPEDSPGYRDLFNAMFAPYDDIECGFVMVRAGEFPESLDNWDAFLITGSDAGVYDNLDWLDGLRALIRDIAASGKPLVGLCFGHQIIADTLGGKAELSDKGWGLGRREVAIKNPPESFAHIAPDRNWSLLYVHRDQVTTPPTGAKVFAGDTFCPIAAYTVGDTILGIQGHPEFTPEVVEAIMAIRDDSIPDAVIEKARGDLDTDNDSATTTDAITDFIRNALAADAGAA